MKETDKHTRQKQVSTGGAFGSFYFITIVGAAVYFVQQSHGFWGFLYALVKALVWPGIVVHRALTLLQIG